MAQSTTISNVIFRVAIALPIYRLFDYKAPAEINPDLVDPGCRLLVPFANGKKIAYLVDKVSSSDFTNSSLKTIEKILDNETLLQEQDMALLHWASRYYHYPLGEVINAAFPILLRKGKPAVIKQQQSYRLSELGNSIDPDKLKRTPKQLILLQKFKLEKQPLTGQQLSKWDKNWRQPLKSLIEKKLLEQTLENNNIFQHYRPTSRQQPLPANQHQQFAIDCINNSLSRFSVFLLEGVTGSGKTEVYMQVISRVLQQQKQIIVLLPEITLTPQLLERFEKRFATPIAVFHSSLSASDRQNAWLNMQQGHAAILLGTRSALFTPLKNPGLIILDEEHDNSFKQQEGFRFSARDVAIVRAKNLNIPIILGSATPSLESLHNAALKRYQLLHLPERAGNAAHPDLMLMDIRNKKLYEGLSVPLIAEIKKTLGKKEQVLIFLNRRGYAPSLICHVCGWVAHCRRCDANLVVHNHDKKLRCHHCCGEQLLPNHCPACRSRELTALGLGTERLENVLTNIFPHEKVIRLDKDTTQGKGVLDNKLGEIQQGNACIILGTQMLAKGHHFPNVTLVAILDVDSGLFSIDFHAAEKLAQLIIQVAGRAGRAEKPGKVILQTRQPEHPLLYHMLNQDYRAFAKTALTERKQAMLPPYSFLALLRVSAVDPQAPGQFLDLVRARIQAEFTTQALILGPVPSPMTRRAGKYRYQMLFQSDKRLELHQLLDWLIPTMDKMKEARKVRWSLDVDPADLY